MKQKINYIEIYFVMPYVTVLSMYIYKLVNNYNSYKNEYLIKKITR